MLKNLVFLATLKLVLVFSCAIDLKGIPFKKNEIRIDNFYGSSLAQTDSVYKIHGIVAFTGSGTLSSVFLNYQVDGMETETTHFENIDINPQIPFYFKAEQPWIPDIAGDFELSIWFSGLNDESVDEPASDTLLVAVGVYEFLPDRKLTLLESFSSVNCGSCAIVNPQVRDLVKNNYDRYSMIFYHPMEWDNSPLYLFNPKDNETRKDYYQITYTPIAVIGSLFNGSTMGVDENIMDIKHNMPAGFEIEGSYYLEENMLHSQIETESFGDFTNQQLRLFLVLTEDSIHFDEPPGHNGEKEFFHVMRSFIPDADGILLDPQEVGTSFSAGLSYEIRSELIDTNQIELLAFIQNFESKEIYQTIRLKQNTPENDDNTLVYYKRKSSAINIFPNPTTGLLNIFFSNEQKVRFIRIFDMKGQQVYKKHIAEQFNGQKTNINLSHLENGFYILQLETPQKPLRKKFTIIR